MICWSRCQDAAAFGEDKLNSRHRTREQHTLTSRRNLFRQILLSSSSSAEGRNDLSVLQLMPLIRMDLSVRKMTLRVNSLLESNVMEEDDYLEQICWQKVGGRETWAWTGVLYGYESGRWCLAEDQIQVTAKIQRLRIGFSLPLILSIRAKETEWVSIILSLSPLLISSPMGHKSSPPTSSESHKSYFFLIKYSHTFPHYVCDAKERERVTMFSFWRLAVCQPFLSDLSFFLFLLLDIIRCVLLPFSDFSLIPLT